MRNTMEDATGHWLKGSSCSRALSIATHHDDLEDLQRPRLIVNSGFPIPPRNSTREIYCVARLIMT